MKTSNRILQVISFLLVLAVGQSATLSAQTTSVTRARSAPGPDPDLFDGSNSEEESRPESGIISDFEMGSGESDPQGSGRQPGGQGSSEQGEGQGGGGGGIPGMPQGQGGQGGDEGLMIETPAMEQQEMSGGQQQSAQQGQQGQQGGQQGQQSSSSSSSSQSSGQKPPQDDVKLGDESLRIDTVEMPADENLVGQDDDGKPETKDSIGGTASGQQGPRRNTGVEQGDAMPSDL